LGLFFLSLISKPMAISLPFVFLALDFWPLNRLGNFGSKVWREKILFFLISFLFLTVSVIAQAQAGSYSSLAQIPLSYRAMNLLHTPFFYLSKMFCPIGLATLYPIDLKKTYSPEYVMMAMGTVFSIAYGWLFWKKRPYLVVAGLFYLITLLPVIGILQIGSQAAADRFTYLPSLGPFLLFAALSTRLLDNKRFVWIALMIGLTLLMSFATIQQTQTWENTVALWENVLKVIPRNCQIAHANLADGYLKEGRWAEALQEFDRGIRLGPPSAFSHDWKGFDLMEMGRLEEAVAEMNAALQLEPRNPRIHLHLGMIDERLGRMSEALEEFQKAVQFDSDFSDAYYQIGIHDLGQKRLGEAKTALQKALVLDPDNAMVWAGLEALARASG
jgi:thioredoxin-like negative regulator of GroEL